MPSLHPKLPRTRSICTAPSESYFNKYLPSAAVLCAPRHGPARRWGTHDHLTFAPDGCRVAVGSLCGHRSDPVSLRLCVDQAAAVGFEMVIISFGAGFDLESTDPKYLEAMRNISDYAR
jgi:hypothetical protein